MAYGDLPLDAPEKENKGKEGGACNRRSCQAEPALWYNHGMRLWYCKDCARDIGDDHVNNRDWMLRWYPECQHPQFETREQINARDAVLPEDEAAVEEVVEKLTVMDFPSRQARRAYEREQRKIMRR